MTTARPAAAGAGRTTLGDQLRIPIEWKCAGLAGWLLAAGVASGQALPFLPAGDSRLRHEVELNQDEDRIPLSTTWPIPINDVPEQYRDLPRASDQPGSATDAGWFINGGVKPNRLRVFEDTPRENGEAGVQGGWAVGDYAGGALHLSYAIHPQDEMHYRADGSYVSWRFGNWWATLGAQERWWGPGWDGSLIFSNNARPMPGITLERASSRAPKVKWMRWLGPYRFVTFMDRMEDRRPDFNKALMWGARFTFQPLTGLEIGLSRTAQWCGTGRPCGLKTFFEMLTARKNAVVNESGPHPDIQSKPAANRVAIDVRWHPVGFPFAVYWQEYGETFDSGNYRPRQLLQLFGAELAARDLFNGRARTFIEFADTACGALGTRPGDTPQFGCAYEKDSYPAGYRFRGRAIGDAMDRDGRRFTIGEIYVDEQDRTWQLRLRRIELNRGGYPAFLVPHTVSVVPEQLWTLEPMVEGRWRAFHYSLGGGLERTYELAHHGLTGYAFASLSSSW